jgi:hypothetical protein
MIPIWQNRLLHPDFEISLNNKAGCFLPIRVMDALPKSRMLLFNNWHGCGLDRVRADRDRGYMKPLETPVCL